MARKLYLIGNSSWSHRIPWRVAQNASYSREHHPLRNSCSSTKPCTSVQFWYRNNRKSIALSHKTNSESFIHTQNPKMDGDVHNINIQKMQKHNIPQASHCNGCIWSRFCDRECLQESSYQRHERSCHKPYIYPRFQWRPSFVFPWADWIYALYLIVRGSKKIQQEKLSNPFLATPPQTSQIEQKTLGYVWKTSTDHTL